MKIDTDVLNELYGLTYSMSRGSPKEKDMARLTEIRNQILENQEKAEKYDIIQREYEKYFDKYGEQLEENKRLKEKISEIQKYTDDYINIEMCTAGEILLDNIRQVLTSKSDSQDSSTGGIDE